MNHKLKRRLTKIMTNKELKKENKEWLNKYNAVVNLAERQNQFIVNLEKNLLLFKSFK